LREAGAAQILSAGVQFSRERRKGDRGSGVNGWQPARIAAALIALAVALALVPAAGADASDPDPGPATGTLVDGGQLTGTAAVDFDDNPAGVYTATITVDGTVLVDQTVSQGSAHLALDTAQLLDGAHAVVVAVGDAQSTDTVWSGTIDTLNAPQGGQPAISGTAQVGATLVASSGSWQPAPSTVAYQWERCPSAGRGCAPIAGASAQSYTLAAADAGSLVAVAVTASDPSGSTTVTSAPSAPVVEPGQSAAGTPNGPDPCTDARLTAQIGSGPSETVVLGAGATLAGELVCGASAVTGATLDLALAPASGTAPTSYAQVQTGSGGTFSYAVPPGPSRDITLTYSAYNGAATPSAVATVALLVTPRITLSISPRATTNGHTIAFSGRVLGGYITRHGLPLDIEYREGARWMTYTEVLASPRSGAFHWRYTFKRTTESITYTFRVAIPPTGVAGYPYQPAASPPRSVHVSP
jgi:hypothetical protein